MMISFDKCAPSEDGPYFGSSMMSQRNGRAMTLERSFRVRDSGAMRELPREINSLPSALLGRVQHRVRARWKPWGRGWKKNFPFGKKLAVV
jgi:hypothetical protein